MAHPGGKCDGPAPKRQHLESKTCGLPPQCCRTIELLICQGRVVYPDACSWTRSKWFSLVIPRSGLTMARPPLARTWATGNCRWRPFLPFHWHVGHEGACLGPGHHGRRCHSASPDHDAPAALGLGATKARIGRTDPKTGPWAFFGAETSVVLK